VFLQGVDEKKATEVAYRLPTSASYLRFLGSATTIPNPLGWIQEYSTPPPSIVLIKRLTVSSLGLLIPVSILAIVGSEMPDLSASTCCDQFNAERPERMAAPSMFASERFIIKELYFMVFI
jgi:hypothetical protein